MEDQLNRRMIVTLLAFVPLLLLLVLGSRFQPPLQPGSPAAIRAVEIAALPGGAMTAPVIGLEPSPLTLTPDAMDAARLKNDGDPFVTGPIAPALPFRFQGSAADFDNARDCLALAAMAEAGQSDVGQRAVI